MIQQLLEWLNSIGLPGLFIVMFLEGSSLPFPGLVIVLSYGYILSPGYIETAFISIGMSFSYTVASIIPYFIGKKLNGRFPKRLEKGVDKAIKFFNRYGIWSIALSRPFGIGNYISYVAGISKVNRWKYLALTFVGIYPWSYVMVLLGNYFKGNVETFKRYFSTYSVYGYIVAFIILGVISVILYRKSKNKKLTEAREGGSSN